MHRWGHPAVNLSETSVPFRMLLLVVRVIEWLHMINRTFKFIYQQPAFVSESLVHIQREHECWERHTGSVQSGLGLWWWWPWPWCYGMSVSCVMYKICVSVPVIVLVSNQALSFGDDDSVLYSIEKWGPLWSSLLKSKGHSVKSNPQVWKLLK